jgi:hypothetical protein
MQQLPYAFRDQYYYRMNVTRKFSNGVLVEFSVDGVSQLDGSVINRTSPAWPIWAKALKQFSTPDDKGIGDVVARMIGDENSMKFKAWHISTFGRPCGCTGRRERWNKQYPL